MSFNIKEIIEGANEGKSQRNSIRDSSLMLIWSALDLLKSSSEYLNSNGFQKINDRSIIFLQNGEDQLLVGEIDSNQASKGVSEWLTALILLEPKYLLAIRDAINYQHKKIVEEPVGDLFIDTLLEGPFFEWAKSSLKRKETNTKADRHVTKNVIEDYINVRRQAAEASTENSKSKRDLFKCFLSQKRIEALHYHLVNSNFIDASASLETFQKIFDGNSDKLEQPILWLKKTISLVYLFFVLDEKQELISRRWQTYLGEKKQAFKNRDGLIKTSNYSSVNRNVKLAINSGKRLMFQDDIDRIVESILSIKH